MTLGQGAPAVVLLNQIVSRSDVLPCTHTFFNKHVRIDCARRDMGHT